MGIDKWENLGIDYELKGAPDATKEDIKKASQIISQFGVEVYNA